MELWCCDHIKGIGLLNHRFHIMSGDFVLFTNLCCYSPEVLNNCQVWISRSSCWRLVAKDWSLQFGILVMSWNIIFCLILLSKQVPRFTMSSVILVSWSSSHFVFLTTHIVLLKQDLATLFDLFDLTVFFLFFWIKNDD